MLTKGYGTEKIEIKRLECTNAQRTIGVRLGPSGGQMCQYKHSLRQTRDWAKRVQVGNIPRDIIKRAYRNVYIPMVTYSFEAKTMIEK